MYYARRSRIDFALIEKLEETYILNAMVRTSIPEYPTLFIDDFDFGTSIPVGHHICKSGYGTGSTCGIINTLNSRLALIRGTDFYHITKVNMETLENDRGGTVFYFTFSDDNAYFMISGYGICSHTYSGNNLAITPLKYIIEFQPIRHLFRNVLFINLNNSGLVP
ncbi:hypothetical protein C2G38_2082836 [Gigaspora rosea]|uniref:Peptidase S1 domain-containing protein n=1 Tax=Gigaspora rosea TaxID=44941 RepID=A0A397VK61_9GLOM|nr:hypothetical protein C2G38_2082836 [Gigaspora rosea]